MVDGRVGQKSEGVHFREALCPWNTDFWFKQEKSILYKLLFSPHEEGGESQRLSVDYLACFSPQKCTLLLSLSSWEMKASGRVGMAEEEKGKEKFMEHLGTCNFLIASLRESISAEHGKVMTVREKRRKPVPALGDVPLLGRPISGF